MDSTATKHPQLVQTAKFQPVKDDAADKHSTECKQQQVVPEILVQNEKGDATDIDSTEDIHKKEIQEVLVQHEEEDAIRRLEEAVDIMTDMAHIRRNSHSHTKEHKIEISPALVKEAIEAFKLFDKGNHQGLDIEELGKVFRALGQNPTDAELREIIRKHDMNHNGRLEEEEFQEMIVSYMKPMWQVKEELKDAFRIFDKRGSGTIAMAELEYVLKRYGEPLTHRQSKELVSLMDKDGDGRVDMDDFVDFLCEVDRPDYFMTRYPARRKSITEHYK